MAPVTGLVSAMVVIAPQVVCVAGVATTVAFGFTVIVNVCGGLEQKPFLALTLMVAVTGAVPAFVAANDAISPEPAPLRPIDGVLLVQLKVAEALVLEKWTAAVFASAQTVCVPPVTVRSGISAGSQDSPKLARIINVFEKAAPNDSTGIQSPPGIVAQFTHMVLLLKMSVV